jgi:hypothetical protein
MSTRRLDRTRSRAVATLLEACEQRTMMDGSFQYTGGLASLPSDRLAALGVNSAPIVIDDINGDGIRDLAASGVRTQYGTQGNTQSIGFVGIYSGADGSVIRDIPAPQYPYYGQGTSPFGASIALGSDMNADGARDLIISDFENSIDGVGTGAFRIYSLRDGTQISAIASNVYSFSSGAFMSAPADLDGDGSVDVVVAGAFYSGGVLVGVNTKAFSSRTGTVIWEGAFGGTFDSYGQRLFRDAIAIGDVNADGTTDLLIGSEDDVQEYGREGFLAVVNGRTGSIIRQWTSGASTISFGGRLAYLGDVTGDGVGEFALIQSARDTNDTTRVNATLSVFSIDATSLASPLWSLALDSWTLGSVVTIGLGRIADQNSDGKADLGVQWTPTSRASFVRVLSGADGTTIRDITSTQVRPDRSRTTGVINFGASIATGDLEGDGFVDLLIGGALAEAPLEGQIDPLKFVTTVPTLKYQSVSIERISPSGIVFGTVGGSRFVTVGGIVTPFAGFDGLLSNDLLVDFNAQGMLLGSASANGADAFILFGGQRILVSGLTQTDLSALGGGFVAAPAGSYGVPQAISLASDQNTALIRRVRDGTVDTTWIVRRNAANTAFELVYLFDGLPAGISHDGETVIANRVDGTASVADRTLSANFTLFSVADFVVKAVGSGTYAGFSVDGLQARFGVIGSISAGEPLPLISSFRTSTTSLTPGLSIVGVSAVGNGQVLTYEAAQTADQQVLLWSRGSDGQWTSNAIDATDLVGLPAGTFAQTPLGLSPRGSILSRVTIGTIPEVAARYVPNAAQGPFTFDSTRPIANAPVGDSGAIIVGFNAFNELIYARRDSDIAAWAGSQLVVPTGATVVGITAWSGGVAVATDQGLIRYIRLSDGSWDSLNLTTASFGATAISRSLRVITTNDRYIILTGVNAQNQVVIYGSQSPNPDQTTAWSYDNLSQSVLGTFNIADPNLQGDLVTYVMPWNGLNIAGINAEGEPVTFWTSPGVSGWRFTNLADAQENPSVASGFTRLVVNVLPWGGVNLTNADSSLRSVWWAPSLGGVWKFASISSVVQSAPSPILVSESVVAFATTWGGQNIAGVDSNGHLWVYWWSPESDRWSGTSLQAAVPSIKDVKFSTRVAAYATSGAVPMGVTAIDTDSHAVHMYFKIGTGWLATDATAEIEEV